MNTRSRILTGIRSNDEPTLGNYLGAFVPMVQLQRQKSADHDINMFVPDLHSFTTPIDHDGLYRRSMKNLRYFVAAGLDISNESTFIYRQSYVPAHSELCVILNNFAYFGELSRMTEFKDKSSRSASGDSVSVGLFDYPVLMAADILLYGAEWVPVGDDQKQHIEITRDIGARFNAKFGDTLFLPRPWKDQFEHMNLDGGLRIRSLLHPDKKMSKSISDPKGTILLSDDPADASRKIIGATTDSIGVINLDWDKQPGIANLLQILAAVQNRGIGDVAAEWTGKTAYGDLKKAVADAVSQLLNGFQAAYNAVDQQALDAKLVASETAMQSVANETLLRVQKAVGLRPR